MSYEVELKFPVPDLSAFSQKLSAQAVAISLPQEEIDLYLAHPSRDFAQTDEALRLRRKGDANFITYKGPKIDATTKTRREIELPLAPGPESLASWSLSWRRSAFARWLKSANPAAKRPFPGKAAALEACLDEVAGVGTFVEFELIAEANELDAARACIESLGQISGPDARRAAELPGISAHRGEMTYLGIEIGGTKLQLAVGHGDGSPLVDFRRAEIRREAGAGGILRQIETLGRELIDHSTGHKPSASASAGPGGRRGGVGRSPAIRSRGWCDFAVVDSVPGGDFPTCRPRFPTMPTPPA